MTAIFISHLSCDDKFANELKAWLADQGYQRVFLDFDKDTGLRAGENWERRLYEELSRSHAVLLILTPNWLDSNWNFAEFTQARALGKIIFPIIVSPSVKSGWPRKSRARICEGMEQRGPSLPAPTHS